MGLVAIERVEPSLGWIPEVDGLVAASHDAGGMGGRQISAAGLVASLETTATRTVHVWVARPAMLPAPSRPRPAIFPTPSRPRPVMLPAPARPRPAIPLPPLVGLISLVATPRRHAIGWLLVHPSVRRQGVGRALVAVAIDAAHGLDAREIWIEVHPAWRGAWAFWRSVGFQPA
jgi:GNAT superfamily N-acetyltransferase